MIFADRGGRRRGFAGAFVETLVFDSVLAYARMMNAHLAVDRTNKYETEWLIYTDVLSRFLGVGVIELRTKLIEERKTCQDIRLCSDRIFIWAYSKVHPW